MEDPSSHRNHILASDILVASCLQSKKLTQGRIVPKRRTEPWYTVFDRCNSHFLHWSAEQWRKKLDFSARYYRLVTRLGPGIHHKLADYCLHLFEIDFLRRLCGTASILSELASFPWTWRLAVHLLFEGNSPSSEPLYQCVDWSAHEQVASLELAPDLSLPQRPDHFRPLREVFTVHSCACLRLDLDRLDAPQR